MSIQKPYRFKVEEEKAILINGSTGKAEYEIESVDVNQSLLAVTAIYRIDKIKIPFTNVEENDMKSIRYHFAEWFI
jgi:hypothetical protein